MSRKQQRRTFSAAQKVAIVWHALADQPRLGLFDRRKQGSRAVPLVVVCHRPAPWPMLARASTPRSDCSPEYLVDTWQSPVRTSEMKKQKAAHLNWLAPLCYGACCTQAGRLA